MSEAEATQTTDATPSEPETWAEQFAAAEQALGGGDGDAPEATEPAKQEDTPAKADDAGGHEPPEAEGEVSPKERVKFREWKRSQREAIAKERAKVEQELQAQLAEVRAEIAQAQELKAFKSALDSGDFDAAAKAAGYSDWKTMQTEVLKSYQSPGYKKTKELERKLAEREEAERRAQEEAQQRAAQEQQTKAQQEYQTKLATDLGASEDTTIATLAKEDPGFARAVMYEQQQEWDGHETIPAEEAAQRAVSKLRQRYEQLGKFFGGQPASQAETPSRGGNPAKPAARPRAPKSITRSQATEVSTPKEMTEEEWRRHFARELRNATP